MKRMIKYITLAAAVSLLTTAPAVAAPVLWAGNGHYYEYVGGSFSFDSALAAADASVALPSYKGYLATITSADENSFIAGLVVAGAGRQLPAWVGGSDRETEGVWKWITGPETGVVFWNGAVVPGQYHNWDRPQEPNDNGNEDGLSAFYNGTPLLNDLRTEAHHGYVVEYRLASKGPAVPEPATWTMMILGFGAAGAMLRRRRISAPRTVRSLVSFRRSAALDGPT